LVTPVTDAIDGIDAGAIHPATTQDGGIFTVVPMAMPAALSAAVGGVEAQS
jgi:hypothetical protein